MPGQLINNQVPASGVVGTTLAPDGQGPFYEDYRLGNDYSYDAGYLVLPIAGPDVIPDNPDYVPYALIKVCAATGMRRQRFKALKAETPPLLPAIGDDTPEGDIFLGGSLSLPLPQINSAGTGFYYSGNGSYLYLQPASPRGYNAEDTFQTGSYPFAIPLLDGLAATTLRAATIDNSGDPDETTDETTQGPLGNIQSDSWQWLSTTWLPAFFLPGLDTDVPSPPITSTLRSV